MTKGIKGNKIEVSTHRHIAVVLLFDPQLTFQHSHSSVSRKNLSDNSLEPRVPPSLVHWFIEIIIIQLIQAEYVSNQENRVLRYT